MDIVFATRTALASHPRHGGVVEVIEGTHYLAADPIVAAYPDLFSADVRSGLKASDPLEADGLPAWAEREPVEAPEESDKADAPEEKKADERAKTPPVETTDATPGTRRRRTRAKGDAK